MKGADKKTPSLPKFIHSHWYTLGAGFVLALIALVIADWPNSTKFLSSKLCLSGAQDRNIFQMVANERAKFILKNRYYARRGHEAGDVQLSLSRSYVECLYEEALSQTSDRQTQNIVSRSSLGQDLRSAIERIPFSKKPMKLNLECDRKKGVATVTLQIVDGGQTSALVLNTRKLDQDQSGMKSSVLAAGSGPINFSCL